MMLRICQLFCLCCLIGFMPMRAGETAPTDRIGPGAQLATLEVGATVYRDVRVKTVNARTVLFLHRGGMASVLLRELSPEMQVRFGYDPAAEAASDAAMQTAIKQREARAAASAKQRRESNRPQFVNVLQQFGTPAKLQTEVDFRPSFRELGLYAKDQGRRPSCSVFAVVSALEFIRAQNTGHAEKLSEEYLVWATMRTIQRLGTAVQDRSQAGDDADTGFALTEVVTALRSYGIPLASSMPNTLNRTTNTADAPTTQIISEARANAQVAVHIVPGRDTATQLNNIVHALNAGIPVAIGTAWPRFFNMRAALLNSQPPAYNHAVTLVGYRCPTGKLEDTTFIFKNSWGAAWGANGYGFATYTYLEQHMHTAILLEVNFRP